jgi:hypothetical protein
VASAGTRLAAPLTGHFGGEPGPGGDVRLGERRPAYILKQFIDVVSRPGARAQARGAGKTF